MSNTMQLAETNLFKVNEKSLMYLLCFYCYKHCFINQERGEKCKYGKF